MRWMGMPMAMWAVFARSFQTQLTAVLGYDAATARAITKKAKPQYRQIIRRLPEFEKAELSYIPYYTWANRDENEMQVWTRVRD